MISVDASESLIGTELSRRGGYRKVYLWCVEEVRLCFGQVKFHVRDLLGRQRLTTVTTTSGPLLRLVKD